MFKSNFAPPFCKRAATRLLGICFMVALLASLQLPAGAQTPPTVSLGAAAGFGLLAGGTLFTDSASAVQVTGQVGAASAVQGPLLASGGIESPIEGVPTTATSTALVAASTARIYFNGLSAQSLTNLNGQTLSGGVYALNGNAAFGAGNPLVLQGTDTTVFVIRVGGNLTLTSGARVWLEGNIAPKNIIWSVSGDLTSIGYAALPGAVLVGGQASLSGEWNAMTALLVAGNLTLNQLRFSFTEPGSNFFAANSLTTPETCHSPAVPSLVSCPNWVYNGSFELADPGLSGGLPTRIANVCNRVSTGVYATVAEVAGWGAASWGTPDWFKAGGTGGTGIPQNAYTWPPDATPARSGNSYTGLFVCRDDPATSRIYREYLMQPMATPLTANRHYYVEFFSRLAPSSAFTMPRLGFRALTGNPYQQASGLLMQAGGTTPVTSILMGHDNNFNSTTAWSQTAGAFQAVGNERFAVIGNFEAGTRTPTGAPSQGQTEDGYQYLDDVLVQEFPEPTIACDNLNQRLTLGVTCPLPTTRATYIWTWIRPGTNQTVTHSSTNPTFTPPNPYALSYTLTIRLQLPDGTFYPDVTYPPLLTSQVFAFSIDFNSPRLNISSGTTATWAGNETVRGTVTVANGATLIIENEAVIRFDDTYYYEQVSPLRTRILVQRGGRLIVQEGAVLTSLIDPAPGPPAPICHRAPMWDGITVEGRGNNTPQTTGSGNQGEVQILDGGTVAHARFGVMAGQAIYEIVTFQGHTGNRVKESSARGGAVVTADRARFLECYIGVHFTTYRNGTADNVSRFDDCTIQSTQLLADPQYQINGIRHGTWIGLRASGVNRIRLTGNLFDGFENVPMQVRGYGISASQATLSLVAAGYVNGDRTQPIRRNEIRDWRYGVYAASNLMNTALRVRGNFFTNNYWALTLWQTNGSDIRYNRFEVGGPGMNAQQFNQPAGLFFEQSLIALPATENVFVAHPLTTAGTYNIGVHVKDIGGITPGEPRMEVYNNQFENLYTGLYTLGNNGNLLFRCNDFNNPIATFATANSNYPSADVNVHGGAPGPQGSCPPFNATADNTANNRFTLNPTNHWHLFLRGGDQTSAQGGQPFDYFFPNPPGTRRRPTAVATLGVVSPPAMMSRIIGCGVNVNNNTDGCGNSPENEDTEALMAQLAQASEGTTTRTDMVAQLVATLLTDPAQEHGLDQAVEVLEAEQNPVFADLLLELQATQAEGLAGDGTGNRSIGRKSRLQPEASTVVDLRRESRAPVNYAHRVRALLLPFGTDSARTVAVMTDSTLRAELQRMADDTLTRGYEAARIALNHYGGANYHPFIAVPGEGPAPADAGRVAVPAVRPTSFLLLTPNPSTGHVRVGYGLPEKATTVVVRVYDEWGQPHGAYALTDEALAEGVTLQLRPGLYQCVLEADGKVAARERLLIIR